MRRSVPFTVTRIIDRGTASAATPAAGVCASIFGAAVATASAAPVPFRNFRREIFFFGLDLLMEEYCSAVGARLRSEEHTSELQSLAYLVCRLLLEKKKGRRRLARRSSVALEFWQNPSR